jgi:hypothetical protein
MIEQLISLLSKNVCQSNGVISYNGKNLRIKCCDGEKEILEPLLNQFKIECEFFGNNEIEITINKSYESVVVFYDEKDYLKRFGNYASEFENYLFAILKIENTYLLKQPNQIFSQKNAIFYNAITYKKLISFISTNADFTSIHDSAMLQLIILSKDNGVFNIGYNSIDSKIHHLSDLNKPLLELQEAFTKLDFIPFFKEAVIQGVHREEIKNRFFAIAQSLQVILELATKDYEIYLRQFAFDKIKTKFKEERNKYFESIEKNIDAVSKQVTSFPLTFAASIFAGYQVKDKPAILILIFLAYFLYTFIAWKILDITALNTDNIKNDVNTEENKIQSGYKLIYEEFKADFEKIKNKLELLSKLICYLRIVLAGLLIAFVVFGIYQNYTAANIKATPIEVKIIK